MDINGLFVWALGSVIRAIQLIWTLKKIFDLYLSVNWIMMTHWAHSNNKILTITRITWITLFLFIPCLDQFWLYLKKSSANAITRKYKYKNLKPIYVIKRTSGLCEWLLYSATQWLDQLHHQSSFACVSISCITWIEGSVIHFNKQKALNKCQAYRMKVLSFTLSFSYRWHYITVSDYVRFWHRFRSSS